MAVAVSLKVMQCPTCGASLKAENNKDAIVCVFCGNTIIPVEEAVSPVRRSDNFAGGTVRIEGIKTSSSALAYMEQFFEEYDWEAFSYAQTLAISELDKLADSLKISSADDKNTWIVCFKALSVPFAHKVLGCQKILEDAISDYKSDSLDAYSKFDAYKRISAVVLGEKQGVLASLNKFTDNAGKYGAESAEIAALRNEIAYIENLAYPAAYGDIEQIPQVVSFIAEKNEKIADELAKEGVDAQAQYAAGKQLLEEKKYVAALNVFLSLRGYLDSKSLVKQINKYFLISDVLEIEGVLYYFKKDNAATNAFSLYPTVDGRISDKPVIENMGKVITNHADIIYYLDSAYKLRMHNLSTNADVKIFKKQLSQKHTFLYERKAYLITAIGVEDSGKRTIIELDLKTGAVNPLLTGVDKVRSMTDNKLVYTVAPTTDDGTNPVFTNILDVKTSAITGLGAREIAVEGFVGDLVVYTQSAPNNFNKNLFIRKLGDNGAEMLVEQNIYSFCDIVEDKLFYYIGNSRNRSLIMINSDGTARLEWPQHITKMLFLQGGWLYFVRRYGYNAVLCKARLDGSKFSIIARDIEEFVQIKNGYLYYINDVSALVKVRMDGSNRQKLCDDVKSVLSVREDKIIFISADDRIQADETPQSIKSVKSIYAVDFADSGKIKLVYNVTAAESYDDSTVYYVVENNAENADKHNSLYKLDVATYGAEKLLDLHMEDENVGGMSKFAIAMLIMTISYFISFFAFLTAANGFAVIALLVGVIAMLVGAGFKVGKYDANSH